jgi:hypothetical protein
MGFLMPKVSAPAPLPPVQPLPEPPAVTPVVKKEEMTEAEKKEVAAREEKISKEQAAIERKRKGRKSTILTGPLGLEDEATIEKKTLLGG